MSLISAQDNRPDRVLASMAAGFLFLAAIFGAMGVVDCIDGRTDSKAGYTLRSEELEAFWRNVRITFGFGAAVLVASGVCYAGSVALRPPKA